MYLHGSLACIPIFILNWNVEAILIALNQEHEIAALAGEFNKYAILGLPGFILYELMQKGLQAQGIVTQMVWISAIDNVLNIGLGYWLGYHTSFGFVGVALGRTICYNLLPVFAYMYMLWNPVHKLWWPENHSWMAQWQTAWKHIPEFLKLGVPGAIVNAVAFYVVGLPLVGLFAFQFEWGLQGTWLGLSVGLTLGVGAYLVIIYRSDWQARADEAILRNEDEKDDIVE
ncbi:hypothetical protein DYB28_001548 [Aphanomyces astaci]|uniref:Polysaccharide biosynthesis protein C-terminal domain-containing protein n=1 Tax=Aphanomyces astaci TaxID=112090 RepID=A0A397A0U9_APHAT|nr:hypothetical protein DYB36_002675 [Aphanomyces astaci]RHY01470.1 hypothetical protein DYB25_002179 [Aphanomyces astaci]RHY62408.1 hypothetical protein DYB34_003403 [Aphanomyces astaci]RHY70146.1 hypothetical protein DYB30_006913 [Aphanomyces astaci]RHZ20310.1 hypothetical protein DYB31_001631 [Aphanomyces astaci]